MTDWDRCIDHFQPGWVELESTAGNVKKCGKIQVDCGKRSHAAAAPPGADSLFQLPPEQCQLFYGNTPRFPYQSK